MKISEILNKKNATISLEVFPPKKAQNISAIQKTVEKMCEFNPEFISVTYGAGGTTSGYTSYIAKTILNRSVTPLSHLTCVNSTKDKVDRVIDELNGLGIENILALRGDIPEGVDISHKRYFSYASELIEEIKTKGDFCIGAACYPETHPESINSKDDLLHLKQKTECGAEFLTTQMFFDNEIFYRFKDNCLKHQIDVPIITGIMPITNIKQIGRSISLSGCSMPQEFTEIAAKYADENGNMAEAGIDYAVKQIKDLMEHGQKNIHIYTMNNLETTRQILDKLV